MYFKRISLSVFAVIEALISVSKVRMKGKKIHFFFLSSACLLFKADRTDRGHNFSHFCIQLIFTYSHNSPYLMDLTLL